MTAPQSQGADTPTAARRRRARVGGRRVRSGLRGTAMGSVDDRDASTVAGRALTIP